MMSFGFLGEYPRWEKLGKIINNFTSFYLVSNVCLGQILQAELDLVASNEFAEILHTGDNIIWNTQHRNIFKIL